MFAWKLAISMARIILLALTVSLMLCKGPYNLSLASSSSVLLSFNSSRSFWLIGTSEQFVVTKYRFQVEPASTAHNGHSLPFANVGENLEKVLLKEVDIILISGIQDIDQMDGYTAIIHQVILIVLARTNVHPPVYLSGIGTDNLTAKALSQMCCKSRFPCCRMPENCNRSTMPLSMKIKYTYFYTFGAEVTWKQNQHKK